jgi:hypothetical protein
MFTKSWLVRAAALAALVSVVGCSRTPVGNYATVSGTVTHNGSPVDGAKVVLHSTVEAGGKKGGMYSATTDSSGKYLIATVGKEPGIPPGMYKVTIVRLDLRGNLPQEGFDAGQMEASGMAKNLLPKDYEDPNRTKLSVTLEAGKNENKNFDLKGQASTTARPATTP